MLGLIKTAKGKYLLRSLIAWTYIAELTGIENTDYATASVGTSIPFHLTLSVLIFPFVGRLMNIWSKFLHPASEMTYGKGLNMGRTDCQYFGVVRIRTHRGTSAGELSS